MVDDELLGMQAESMASAFALHAVIREVFPDPVDRAKVATAAISDFEDYVETYPDSPTRETFRLAAVDQIRRLFRDTA